MRSIFFLLAALLYFTTYVNCVNNKNSTSPRERGVVEIDVKKSSLVGKYIGNLPCVDCDAINTILELNQDHSYLLTYYYQGKSNDEFSKTGVWDLEKDKLELVGIDYKYKVQEGGLVQLDLSGKEIMGDLAENYFLNKIK